LILIFFFLADVLKGKRNLLKIEKFTSTTLHCAI
jgi:hypothetical protein